MRVPVSAKHVALALTALTAGFLGYFSIPNALAIHYLGLNTRHGFEKATRLEPSNALNWYSLGRYWQLNIENPDLDRDVSAYRKALARKIHDFRSTKGLAMVQIRCLRGFDTKSEAFA